MPIYEYRCEDCGHQFEKIRSFSKKDEKIECPICGKENTERVLSVFSSGSSGYKRKCSPSGST